jgi:mannose-6-phosphate isomerase
MAPDRPAFASLPEARAGLRAWLREAALPLWAGPGVDPQTGAFREALTIDGQAHDPRRRARVQARQAFVFATAAHAGLGDLWGEVARRGAEHFLDCYRRPDGLFVHTLTPAGEVSDRAARLYEHAFVLLALSALSRAEPGAAAYAAEGEALRDRLEGFRHSAGGFREVDEPVFQANAQMHLFEAALAWEAAGATGWAALADELAALALERFIDPETGALHEAFDAGWRPLRSGADVIEPGHQFEWAWLLGRWGRMRGTAAAAARAQRLYAVGLRGFDPRRGVVVGQLHEDLSVRDAGARLWAQTEFLRAALMFGDQTETLMAANAVARFLATPVPGVWRERMDPVGAFVEEPAPATSLYHVTTAILELG